MPALDLDAMRAAVEAPTIRLDGRTFRGRILSAEEFWPIVPYLQGAAAMTPGEQVALCRAFLRLLFPWRPWMLWRGDPVRRLMRLPTVQLLTVTLGFFGQQASIHGATMPMPDAPETSGTSSSG